MRWDGTNGSMPIFGRGLLLAAIYASSARLQQAHRAFELTALRVISEVDTLIVSTDKNRTINEQRNCQRSYFRQVS
ncbi:MAG: outer membrane protein TolC [Candidatus Endobugula sp.]|jgi:outer membrane protein TolC